MASGLSSTRIALRPCVSAHSPRVPLPAKKSKQVSSGLECTRTSRFRIPLGFWVGYPVFSLPLVGTMVCQNTSVGVLPLAAFSSPTRLGARYGMRSISS